MRHFAVVLVFLALAGPAAAATPRFAVYDLQTDLAQASRNTYGDVEVKPRAALAGHGTLAQCGVTCRFGPGWLAFSARPHLSASDVSAAVSGYSTHRGWFVRVTLHAAAVPHWAAFAKRVATGAKLRGVPDVLVVVADGQIAALPLATQITSSGGTVTLTGFSRASARSLAKLL